MRRRCSEIRYGGFSNIARCGRDHFPCPRSPVDPAQIGGHRLAVLPTIKCLKMSIIDHGDYRRTAPNVMAAIADGYFAFEAAA